MNSPIRLFSSAARPVKRCAAMVCGAACPQDVIERLSADNPEVCFDCYATETSSSPALCPYADIYLIISAREILGIEEFWLDDHDSFRNISLRNRRIFITNYDNDVLSPDWQTFIQGFTNRGAEAFLINSAN